ncbi:hypothetical protein [Halomicrococcus gelatinilyticus]|uniref:hypothetical protein n=1 Tax=Halomicrococcus gelatinilyticus TaxID=1702103 RepID=UPI002E132049
MGVFDSTRFLDPRDAFAVAPTRAAVLYLGYGLLLASFVFPWAVHDSGYKTGTTYAFGAGRWVPFWAYPFTLGMTVYEVFAPFGQDSIRADSFLLGTMFAGMGAVIIIYDDPRLGSYLAVVGGIAIAAVNVYDLLVDGLLVNIVKEQHGEDEFADLPPDHPWRE